jgi:methyl-accepting chemotaxis protein
MFDSITQRVRKSLDDRKNDLGIDSDTTLTLRGMLSSSNAAMPKLKQNLVDALAANPTYFGRFNNDRAHLSRIVDKLGDHMTRLYSGRISSEYEDRARYISSKHAKMGLTLHDQMIAFTLMMTHMVDAASRRSLFPWTRRKRVDAAIRAMMLEMDIQFSNYMEERENAASHIKSNVGSDFNNSIGEIVEGLASTAEQNREAVNSAASASEQLSASMQQIRDRMTEAGRVTSGAERLATDASEQVARLSGKVETISEAVRMISEIANKTNLLALNASIEAARAGAVGRGFNVVAGEVKNLAAQTTTVTDNINNQIEAVRAETDLAVANVNQILERVRVVDQASQEVNIGLKEQGETFNSIIMTSVDQSRVGSEMVAKQAYSLRETADNFLERINR